MITVYRPLIQELPDKSEKKYLWSVIAVSLLFVISMTYLQGSSRSFWAGFVLSIGIPNCLGRIFQRAQKPQKDIGSIINASKSLTAICWIVAIVVFAGIILAGLGVQPLNEILGEWPDPVFGSVPSWLMSLGWIVFFPVFRVATFIEKRTWLCWVWASAASAIALAILHFQHRMA